ncbi:DNA-binding NarL/FixJ family response regulator [Compostimonas suwonensis]|uniref:DNA-binding NarL/FixJ family response regulator n=2 Tax=Compostimonas suwonensis TaxID=1048394 RepID=A0A2M9C4V6_9MICO|nr:response regulator transcription factor [Compostimonas suwonensis]PJJ65542.1 DNA-binding NarL/FixJ family response regulator [Compostimonas suwonensis]
MSDRRETHEPEGRDIRVLLVDDQALLRVGFRMVLDAEEGIDVVGEASDGVEAVELAARLRPDVVLMDVRMPRLDGIAATERIVAAQPAARIIILTTFDLDEYAFGGLRAGASGFLLKDARPAELVAAIRSVDRGDASISPRITRKMLDLVVPQLAGEEPDSEQLRLLATLTEREREVLVAVAGGLSNAEIAERFFLSESTVKTHVSRVLLKLGLRDRVQAVIFAYEQGLV